MAGAASPLKAAGFTVDAVESRQFGDYLPQLQALKASGQTPEVVVVHLGTNGNINEDDAREFFDAPCRRAQGHRAAELGRSFLD